MGRHQRGNHVIEPGGSVSRRSFARRALLAAPAVLVAEQVVAAPSADAASSTPWLVGGNALATGGVFGTTSNYSVQFQTAGRERVRITAAGSVGIGTPAPSAPLSVVGATTGTGSAVRVDQAATGAQDSVTATSATKSGGNAVAGYLTAKSPGRDAAGVYGDVESTTDTLAAGVWGQHAGAGRGVVALALGAGTGIDAITGAYNGVAGQFTNANHSSSNDTGTAVRALAGSGTYAQLRDAFTNLPSHFRPGFAAGEFAGDYGVIATASGDHTLTAGVLGAGDTGVLGVPTTDDGVGVYALSNTSQYSDAIFASTAASTATAIFAANNVSGTAGTALTAFGNVEIDGNLSKSGGSFKIDHPLDPAGKYLYHSFVESPDMMNVYNGVVALDGAGRATVSMPDWFEALNREFRYQLTPIGAAAPDLHVAAEVSGGRFTIAGGRPHGKVSWQLTGVRQDAWAEAHRIPVEQAKPPADVGRYLHPELVGHPHAQHITAIDVRMQRAHPVDNGSALRAPR